MGPREKALTEASHGAAMIVLPVLALLRFGGDLPSWSPLPALALMIWGGLSLFNGAKFSVGWRDPKLIARAALKIVFALLALRAHDYPAVVMALLPPLGWWLLVTGITKLYLLLRGFPQPVWGGDPGMPHGEAGFWNPNQPE
jgi:hypothetical protein